MVYRPAVTPVPEFHTSDRLEGIPVGSWVRYRITRDGQAAVLTLGAVSAEPDALWVEVVEDGDPRRHSLRRITFDGRVTRARCREVAADGRQSETAEQPVTQGGVPLATPEGEVTESPTRAELQGRVLEATERRLVFRDEALGTEQRVTEIWARDVPPIYEGREEGGLVRRTGAAASVELVEFGAGYRPLLAP